jgi:putative ABC transport system permease protein
MDSHQARALNAFVDLGVLRRAVLGREAGQKVNLVLVAGDRENAAPLREILGLGDLGLFLEVGEDQVTVLSREFVLRPELSEAVTGLAKERDWAAQPVLTYLANSIAAGGRSVPYSTITALDPPAAERLGAFRLVDGSPAPALEDDEILLNTWAAEDLGAEPGDPIEVTYFVVGDRDELSTATASFRLRGVVAMEGLAVDPWLTPEFPGMAEADDISSWDPPFPVDLEVIRERDEAYWDSWRATPKAFVSGRAGRDLWRSRFGDRTSIRLAPAVGEDPHGLARTLAADLPRALEPETLGFRVRHLREERLRQARGATDFAGLFLALSMFLIAAGAMLVGLLFRLGVEQRAGEIGLLRSVGFPNRRIRRRLMAEGGLLAACGATLGLLLALGYAGAMLAGLRTWWLPAVGTPVLFLHVSAASLAIGWSASVGVVLLSIRLSVRKLHRVPAPALLAGSTTPPDEPDHPRRARPVALGAAGLAVILLLVAGATGSTSSAGLAFGIGASVLVAGLAGLTHRLGPRRRRANSIGAFPVIGMGTRNAGRNRGRSLLSVALVACACFVIVVVAANRVHRERDVVDPASGAGGFTLLAESDVALTEDLSDDRRRRELGFSPESSAALEGVSFFPFRLLPGEDVSCLNLYQPERPRVLGVPTELVARGGFTFQQSAEEVANPWTLLETDLGPGVIPAVADNNSALWILHRGLGDDLVMRNELGAEVRLRLVGLLSRSVFQSEVLVSEENFTKHFPSRAGYQVFLADPPPAEVERVGGLLEANLESLGFDTVGTARKIDSYLAVESTYLATFQTLGGLGLVLGTLGLGIVLLRNVLERRSELATLRAFGFRRATLSRMVLAENAWLLVAGITIGGLSGLIASVPHLISGGTGIPWASLLATLTVVFLVGMTASVLAVAGTLEVPLLPALKAD